ncbi:hypothetical protein Tco_1435015 [Tanacetum coccineum]
MNYSLLYLVLLAHPLEVIAPITEVVAPKPAASTGLPSSTTVDQDTPSPKDMDQDSAHMVVASKVPILKPKNGNTAPKTTVVEGVEKVVPPITAKEKAQKILEVKARSTLMMGIPNEHQLKFNSIKDAKKLV